MKELVNQIAEHAFFFIGILAILAGVALLTLLIRKRMGQAKEEQKQLFEEEQLFRMISDSSFQVYILVEEENLLPIYVSDSVQEVLGLDKEDVMTDLTALGWTLDEEEKSRLKGLWEAWDRRNPFLADYVSFHFKTREKQYMLLRVEESQETGCYTILIQNINEQKQTEFALREQLEQAEEENKAKTEFLSRMSHEIRTPMNGILGMLELAKMDIDQKDKVEDYLDKVNSLSQFLLSLINDILDLSRIESGKTELLCEPFDLFAMAEKLRSMFQQTITEKGIRFQIDMEDFDVHCVRGDEMRLSQVIINFLSNAVKFTEAGGEICVTFRQMQITEDSLRLMIRVRDTGKGIEPEFLNRIFKPFEQEDNKIAEKYGGSGLGMAISDNIIRLMGGQIVIDSEVGRGSDFTVFLSLPVAEKNVAEGKSEDRQNSDRVPEDMLEKYLAGIHVILAEDNDINAKISVKLLEKDGMIVDRVNNGKEAVTTFANSPEGYYDVILMDIQMPELNGWDATRQIRSMERADAHKISIYALSANAFVEDKRHSMEVGMDAHISKPIDFKKLREMIGAAVRENRA